MKKYFFLVCLMLSAMMVFAQETKKVAILEVVDKEGNLSYSQKLALRTYMAHAVSNTNGYEAYNRSDVDLIMSEHEFQRTGLVREDEIRKLGEMTGVLYVLVTEAAPIEGYGLIVIGQLLNVETGKIETIEQELMGTSAQEIQNGCQSLAKKLIKESLDSQIQTAQGHRNNLITKFSNNEYMIADNQLDKKAFEQFIYRNCPLAWQQYTLGRKLIIGGWSAFGAGCAFTIMGGMLVIVSRDALIPLVTIGSIGVVGSIPLLSVGYSKKNNAYKVYNSMCVDKGSQISFNLTAGQNGLGLAIQF